jgi:sugar phosphate permease
MIKNKWLIFAIVVSLYFLSYFYRVSTAIISPDLVKEFKIGAESLGFLSSIYFYTFALAQFPLGPALDRIGPRKMMTILGIVAAIGAIIFAAGSSFTYAVMGRGLIGLGVSVAYMGTLKILANWFETDEFAMMSALAMAIGNAGAIAATTPLAYTVSFIGWRMTFALIGIINFIVVLLIFIFVRDYSPVKHDLFKKSDNINIKESYKIVLLNKDFWIISLLTFFWFGSFLGVQGLWGGPYLMDIFKFSKPESGNILSMIAFGFIAGGPILGRISDKVLKSRKRLIFISLVIFTLNIFLLIAFKNHLSKNLLYILFFTFGFFGSSGIIAYAHLKELFPLSISGTAMTSLNFFAIIGAAILQHGMGAIIEHFGKLPDGTYPFIAYKYAFMFAIVGMCISLFFYLFSKEK